MDLYSYELTNDEILAKRSFRWVRFCLDQDLYKSKTKYFHKLKPKWNVEPFKKSSLKKIPKKQGIYMFVLDIGTEININSTSKYVLYIGQAENLYTRFNQYFDYEKSDEPSDFWKRCMVVIWKDILDFHFFETGKLTTQNLTKVEFDLIDSIVPRINQRFRGKVLKSAIKLYSLAA